MAGSVRCVAVAGAALLPVGKSAAVALPVAVLLGAFAAGIEELALGVIQIPDCGRILGICGMLTDVDCPLVPLRKNVFEVAAQLVVIISATKPANQSTQQV